jgi:hypothetical protein
MISLMQRPLPDSAQPTIAASKRPQTHALDHAVADTGRGKGYFLIYHTHCNFDAENGQCPNKNVPMN